MPPDEPITLSPKVSNVRTALSFLKNKLASLPCVELFLLSAMSAWLLFAKLLQAYWLRVHAFDTGIYANILWNLSNGRGFYSTILGKSHLGEHFSPILVIFSPLAVFINPTFVLMAAQGLCVGATMFLLWAIAHDVLRDVKELPRRLIAGGVAALFVVYRPATAATWFEFHPSTLGMPLIAGIIYALRRGRLGWAWTVVPFLLATKEV